MKCILTYAISNGNYGNFIFLTQTKLEEQSILLELIHILTNLLKRMNLSMEHLLKQDIENGDRHVTGWYLIVI